MMTLHIKSWMIMAQYGIALLAFGFAAYLQHTYGGYEAPLIFVILGLLNAGLALFSQRTPVVRADDEGLSVRTAILSRRFDATWSDVERFEMDDKKRLELRTVDGRSTFIPTHGLEPEEVEALARLAEMRRGAALDPVSEGTA